MIKYIKRVLFFIFFVAILCGAVFLGYEFNTRNYDILKSQIDVSNYNAKYVIPGGQTIGVELKTEGVLVVGLADIVNTNKVSTSPAKACGIRIGDKILGVDDLPVQGINQLLEYTQEKGVKEYTLKIEREGNISDFYITPVQIYESNEIKFGFWAREDIAGIGTVTFVDPETGKYSAIGHGISDTDTKELIDIRTGVISKANITNIKLGKKGDPGEIIGYILKGENSLGSVENNTNFGIYGEVNDESMSYFETENLLEIGTRDDIQTGFAQIYSCVNNEIKIYDVEITKLFFQNRPDEKSFIIKIVDEELLELTNGIIQGMSGCPIIQNNKIVGAVTHVFMNDPTKGYGIYIEWLLDNMYHENEKSAI